MANIKIENGGITTGFLNLLKEKQKNGELNSNMSLKFNREQWNRILSTFAELNDVRKANNEKLIFTGGSDYSSNNWHRNFIVKRGSIELSESEEFALIKAAFGAEFSNTEVKAEKPQKKDGGQASVVPEGIVEVERPQVTSVQVISPKQQKNTEKQKEEKAPVKEPVIDGLKPKEAVQIEQPQTESVVPAAPIFSYGDQGVANNAVTRVIDNSKKSSVDNDKVVAEEVETVVEEVAKEEAPKQEAVPTGKDPFDAGAFKSRIEGSKPSADIVKAQTDALNIGIDLRNQATKVDLAEMKQYNRTYKNGDPTQEWDDYVDRYTGTDFMQKCNIADKKVDGDIYDLKSKDNLADRIIKEEDSERCTLVDLLKGSSFAQHLMRETKVGDEPGLNLNNIEGLDVLNIENLTLKNTNEQIDKVGKSLAVAADKIQESLGILDSKIKASIANVDSQNENIRTQITAAESAMGLIKGEIKLSSEEKKEFLTEYRNNKALIDNIKNVITDAEGNEIGKEEYTTYKSFGRRKFAREAGDKEIVTNQFDNLRFGMTEDGKYTWDYTYVPEEEREAVEAAMTRLVNAYPRIEQEMKALAEASKQITELRQGAIDGLKDVVKYEVLRSQLDEIKTKLNEKSDELILISQNLKEIDEFYEVAKNTEEKTYETEKNNLAKATDRADYKVGRTNEKGNESREVLGEDDDNTKFDASKDNRRSKKAGKKAEEGKKEADKAAERVIKQQEAEAAVKKHDSAVYDRDDALNMYKPAGTITDENGVPENLKSQYRVAVRLFSNFDLELYGNTIRVKDKESGEVKYEFDENTSLSEIRQVKL